MMFPGVEVTVYLTMGEPPVVSGAVKATLALALSAVANTAFGALGAVARTNTACEDVDSMLGPTSLNAETVKV
jgi:hypothetical protein